MWHSKDWRFHPGGLGSQSDQPKPRFDKAAANQRRETNADMFFGRAAASLPELQLNRDGRDESGVYGCAR